MRHGQPALASVAKLSPAAMRGWIADYEAASITAQPPSQASLELAGRARQVISSNAPRALASLAALGLEPQLSESLFSEAQLPHGHWTLPRLSPFTWAFILRMRWLCGFNGQVESADQARARAAQAASRLQSMATEGPLLLMGHGFMNRLIGKQLQSQGWTRHSRDGQGYWSAAVYRLPANSV